MGTSSSRLRRASLLLVGGSLLAILASTGCPPGPPKIVLEDIHAGAFMVMDNGSFAFDGKSRSGKVHEPTPICDDAGGQWGECDPDHFESGYRHGVLFQMGYTVWFDDADHHDHASLPHVIEREDAVLPGLPSVDGLVTAAARSEKSYFGGVYIKHADGEEWLVRGDRKSKQFDWLDVRDADSDCVIDPLGAYLMLVSPDVDVPNGCPDPGTLTDPAYHCSRNRSVHVDVEAHWLITYWSTGEDYELLPGETTEKTIELPAGGTYGPTHGGSHVSYTLKLPKSVVVDRWYLGCHQEHYTGVTEIRVLFHDGGADHLGFPHMPMNGGRGG